MGASISRRGAILRDVVRARDRALLHARRGRACLGPGAPRTLEPIGARPADRLSQDDRQDAQLGGADTAADPRSPWPAGRLRGTAARLDPGILSPTSPDPVRAPRHGTLAAETQRTHPARRTRTGGLSSPGGGGCFRSRRAYGALPVVAGRAPISVTPRARHPASRDRRPAPSGAGTFQAYHGGGAGRARSVGDELIGADREWRRQPARMARRRAVEQGRKRPRRASGEGRIPQGTRRGSAGLAGSAARRLR